MERGELSANEEAAESAAEGTGVGLGESEADEAGRVDQLPGANARECSVSVRSASTEPTGLMGWIAIF